VLIVPPSFRPGNEFLYRREFAPRAE